MLLIEVVFLRMMKLVMFVCFRWIVILRLVKLVLMMVMLMVLFGLLWLGGLKGNV